MKKLLIISLLFIGCQKTNVAPNEPTCECGIVTEANMNIGVGYAYMQHKVRNECSQNNQIIDLSGYLSQPGNSANVGDYVCVGYSW
jgi:hypothetical protein